MKAVILCGGMGTRIRDVADNIPKPMIPIGGYPIIWHIMNLYAYYGHNEFVLCLGHLGWQIKSYFINYNSRVYDINLDLATSNIDLIPNYNHNIDWKITMAETGELTMTGGRINQIRKYVEKDDYFLLTYGDGLSNVDINAAIEFHKKHGKIGTVTGVRPAGRFGEIEVNDNHQITEFNEKPQTTIGRINGGFFVFDSKRIWKYLSDDPDLVFENSPLQSMAKDGELMMFPHDGFWQPMDTYREYKLLNNIWNKEKDKRNVPWPGKIYRQ